MNPVTRHEGICVPIIVNNVDTDQIIPSREMTRISREGIGKGLFADWRYNYEGKKKVGLVDDFVLNRKKYSGATILLGGRNFGCGSSREHAVWALRDFGFVAIIAESFGRIFRNNCARNGLLAIDLPAASIETIRKLTATDPETSKVVVDLTRNEVQAPGGQVFAFEISEPDRRMLLSGLDYIDFTLQFSNDIECFIEQDRLTRPWAHL